jgi:hypothetical protein
MESEISWGTAGTGQFSGIIGDRPNAVHLMIIGAQQYLLFMSSFPFLGKYCFVRRLTTRGLDRPLGLV